MKLRNKKTGEIKEFALFDEEDLQGGATLESLVEEWEDYKPAEPLIEDERVRKAVRAWAEANGFSVFKVYNQHFNYVKIHGTKDRYDPNGSTIEFLGTIAGAEKRTYEIAELCGEEEE